MTLHKRIETVTNIKDKRKKLKIVFVCFVLFCCVDVAGTKNDVKNEWKKDKRETEKKSAHN